MSAQIRKLEDELGVMLFERTSSGIHVTPVGQQIIAHARGLIEQAQAIKSVARKSDGLPAGAARFGILSSSAPSLLTSSICAVRRQIDALQIDVQEGSSAHLLASLKNYTIDLIIGLRPADESGLQWLPLYWEPYILCGRPKDQRGTAVEPHYILDDGGTVSIMTAGGMTDLGVGLREHLGQRLTAAGTVSSIATLNALLNSSDCVVFAPLTATGLITGSDVSRNRIGSPNIGRTVGLVWRTSYPWTPRCHDIYDIMRANLPEGVQSLESNSHRD